MKQSTFELIFIQILKPLNVISYNINIETPLYMMFELPCARPHTISAWRCYILVIPCALMVCLIYTP